MKKMHEEKSFYVSLVWIQTWKKNKVSLLYKRKNMIKWNHWQSYQFCLTLFLISPTNYITVKIYEKNPLLSCSSIISSNSVAFIFCSSFLFFSQKYDLYFFILTITKRLIFSFIFSLTFHLFLRHHFRFGFYPPHQYNPKHSISFASSSSFFFQNWNAPRK